MRQLLMSIKPGILKEMSFGGPFEENRLRLSD